MKIQLDFSSITIENAILKIEDSIIEEDWLKDCLIFLKSYKNQTEFTFQTSGTTGKKKKIKVLKEQMIFSASATLQYFNLKPSQKVFLSLSTNYVAGKMMIVRAIIGKLSLTLAPPSTSPSKYISEEYDFAPFVPMQMLDLLESGKIKNFDKILIGGGNVDSRLLNPLADFKTVIFESFGTTETLTHFAIKRLLPDKENYFKTLPGFTVKTNNDNELILNKNKLIKESLCTKDLIKLKSESEFQWIGRSDNLINSGGVKIIPEEVEKKIQQYITTPFVIVGLTDEKFGEIVVLVSEGKTIEELKNTALNISKYELPKKYFVLNEFPRTESGKIKRKQISELIKT